MITYGNRLLDHILQWVTGLTNNLMEERLDDFVVQLMDYADVE
ncbi:hypothetical protein [Lentibacillus kapialis]|nr:hypothetical protein [Lentibacillus kapialis]